MINITEVVVRAILVEDGAARPAGRPSPAAAAGPGLSDDARLLLVEDCVRQAQNTKY